MPKMIIIECSDEEADRMVEQLKNLIGTDRVVILRLDARNFVRQPVMHVGRRFFEDVAERVFHGVLVYPHAGSELIAPEVSKRSLKSLLVTIRFMLHFDI